MCFAPCAAMFECPIIAVHWNEIDWYGWCVCVYWKMESRTYTYRRDTIKSRPFGGSTLDICGSKILSNVITISAVVHLDRPKKSDWGNWFLQREQSLTAVQLRVWGKGQSEKSVHLFELFFFLSVSRVQKCAKRTVFVSKMNSVHVRACARF